MFNLGVLEPTNLSILLFHLSVCQKVPNLTNMVKAPWIHWKGKLDAVSQQIVCSTLASETAFRFYGHLTFAVAASFQMECWESCS
jgi:hypothetical protein